MWLPVFWRHKKRYIAGLSLLWACGDYSTDPPVEASPARPQYQSGLVLDAYVGAHQDDWQFFMGDHAARSLLAGNKVLFVYLTAGDAGRDSTYWTTRERAANASIDTLVRVGSWSCGTHTVSSHPIKRCTKANTVSYYLRLPDGNSGDGFGYGFGSLRWLRDRATAVMPRDSSTTYTTWSDLTSTVRAIILEEAGGLPVHLRGPEYDRDLNPSDHRDHTAAGDAALAAALNLGWRYDLFVGYNTSQRPVNLTAEETEWKRLLMAAYDRVGIAAGLGGAGGSVWYSRTYYRADPSSPPPANLLRVNLTPSSATVLTDDVVTLSAAGDYDDGITRSLSVTFSASGGTVLQTGSFTSTQPGTFSVIGTHQQSGLADTAVIVVDARPVVMSRVELTPASVSLQPQDTVRFAAVGIMSNGTTAPVSVAYTAQGGQISEAGLYTAGSAGGLFKLIASAANGLADTSTIAITAPPPPGSPFTKLLGDDWLGYTSATALRAAAYFAWSDPRDVYSFVDLVNDPTFGQVVRLTQPAGSTASPRLSKNLPSPRDRVWYRWKMKFSPGWTTAGTGTGASTYGLAEWRWSSHVGQGTLSFQSSAYSIAFSVRERTTLAYVRYTETPLSTALNFGAVNSEWSSGEWWEYVVYYERTSATTARQHFWRRPLTVSGAVAPGPWIYYGFALSGGNTPNVASIVLGMTKSKGTVTTQYIYLGPWEVVDGAVFPNPFGMPNL